MLDAMVLGEKRVISYRTLSSELSISTAEAQRCLLDYIKVRTEKLLATWAVTSESESIRRIALVKGTQPPIEGDVRSVSVWAVAPAALPDSADAQAWIVTDRIRELQIVKTSPAEANELRDNRWNRIQSETAGWAAGGTAARQRERMEALSKEKKEAAKKKQSTGLVAKVKAQAAAREADRRRKFDTVKNSAVNFSRPTSKSGKNANTFARPKTADGSKPTSTAFRTLGDSLLKKRRPSSEPMNAKNAPSKKGRRIVEDSDDDDSNSSHSDGDDEEEDELAQQRLAMEAEALEAERAEEERKATDMHAVDVDESEDVERFAPGSLKSSDKKPSNKVLNPPGSGVASNGKGEKRKSFAKRDIADKSEGQSEPPRKKYKPVVTEVTEQTPDGYIRTVRVTKYLDDDGNERPEDKAPKESGNSRGSLSPLAETVNNKMSRMTENGNGAFEKDGAGRDTQKNTIKPKKTSSKAPNKSSKVTAKNAESGENEDSGEEEKKGRRKSTKSKKPNKSIMSYFGKKS